jgi:predicted nucleotide-binding protein
VAARARGLRDIPPQPSPPGSTELNWRSATIPPAISGWSFCDHKQSRAAPLLRQGISPLARDLFQMSPSRSRPELVVPLDTAISELTTRMSLGKELDEKLKEADYPNWEELKQSYEKWNSFNYELLRSLFTTSEIADEYVGFEALVSRGYRSMQEESERLRQKVVDRVHRLDSISGRLGLYVPRATSLPAAPVSENATSSGQAKNNNVFLVHGHDVAAKEAVARFLSTIGLNPIILHEQASGSRTIIEKFEHYADVEFAVVLLTPDDIGYAKNTPGDARPRARQNVILELGYFAGLLTRARLCALVVDDVEIPSDILGIVYVKMDERQAWRFELARELKSSGFQIDLNKLASS